ncbi:winged helix-turn-helix transcriptional regulator [Nocardiopsis metallicus]|uniref:DNA-binding HxlR family transcriptional regulator n=1 Tax=Nocardiopsis metallicus TaxID=179819 RepID=A0A840WKQ0_9ACTN|nr:winged helix-turn-helix transcriptional regulator [Nocardiopsis metallicus]MBB5490678.1 DNA-binding HxlR family transcriptional regulator [Nocardiopsis metallicus]
MSPSASKDTGKNTKDAAAEPTRLPRIGGRQLPADCPQRALLRDVTSKWGVLVLVALSEGPRRWSDLRHGIDGISEKMLAQTLRALEADGLLFRDARPVVPPYVEYGLTSDGREVTALLLPLLDWVEGYTTQGRSTAFPG